MNVDPQKITTDVKYSFCKQTGQLQCMLSVSWSKLK